MWLERTRGMGRLRNALWVVAFLLLLAGGIVFVHHCSGCLADWAIRVGNPDVLPGGAP